MKKSKTSAVVKHHPTFDSAAFYAPYVPLVHSGKSWWKSDKVYRNAVPKQVSNTDYASDWYEWCAVVRLTGTPFRNFLPHQSSPPVIPEIEEWCRDNEIDVWGEYDLLMFDTIDDAMLFHMTFNVVKYL